MAGTVRVETTPACPLKCVRIIAGWFINRGKTSYSYSRDHVKGIFKFVGKGLHVFCVQLYFLVRYVNKSTYFEHLGKKRNSNSPQLIQGSIYLFAAQMNIQMTTYQPECIRDRS